MNPDEYDLETLVSRLRTPLGRKGLAGIFIEVLRRAEYEYMEHNQSYEGRLRAQAEGVVDWLEGHVEELEKPRSPRRDEA